MSGPLPPLVPEPGLDGGRPAAPSIGSGGAPVRLVGRVVASTGAEPVIETAQGRATLQGAPPLRQGATLILELARYDSASLRTGRLVSVDQQRLEPPVPIRLRPAPAAPPQAGPLRPATGLEVELRSVGPGGRPVGPRLTAHLIPAPERGAFGSGRALSPPSTAPTPAAHGSVTPGANAPAQTRLPMDGASVAPTLRAGPTAPASTAPVSAPHPVAAAGVPEPAQALALRNPIEVVVRREARGRVLLRGAGSTFVVETPLELPIGARLRLTVAGSPARAHPPFGSGPLEAVRELGAALREGAWADEAVPTPPRLPQADASLAARLLRLIQLIGEQAAATGLGRAPEPGDAEAKSEGQRIAAALAELGRLAGEPQSGGWRAFLLPLGFAGAPMLRLYLREDPLPDEGEEERAHERRPTSRRAVFELEFGELGRCQIDVLCLAQRFDLSLRTERVLGSHLRREIRELYLAARNAAGLAGELRFLTGAWTTLPDPGGPGAGITV